jgi:hypothetical protein
MNLLNHLVYVAMLESLSKQMLTVDGRQIICPVLSHWNLRSKIEQACPYLKNIGYKLLLHGIDITLFEIEECQEGAISVVLTNPDNESAFYNDIWDILEGSGDRVQWADGLWVCRSQNLDNTWCYYCE